MCKKMVVYLLAAVMVFTSVDFRVLATEADEVVYGVEMSVGGESEEEKDSAGFQERENKIEEEDDIGKLEENEDVESEDGETEENEAEQEWKTGQENEEEQDGERDEENEEESGISDNDIGNLVLEEAEGELENISYMLSDEIVEANSVGLDEAWVSDYIFEEKEVSQFSCYGNASKSEDTITLTTGARQGGIFLINEKIAKMNYCMIEFDVFLGGNRGGGADGVSVSFAPTINTSIPAGDKIGVNNGSVGVCYTTYTENRSQTIKIVEDSAYTSKQSYVPDTYLDDNKWHTTKILYYDNIMSVIFDDQQVLYYTGIREIPEGYISIRGTTGASYNHQQVRNIKLYNVTKLTDGAGQCGGEATWELKNTESGIVLEISGHGNIYDYDTEAAPWSFAATYINHIVINEGITGIGRGDFDGFPDLVDVSIPESVVQIGEGAFNNCVSLSEVNYNSTDSKWKNIKIEGKNNDYLLYAYDATIKKISLKYDRDFQKIQSSYEFRWGYNKFQNSPDNFDTDLAMMGVMMSSGAYNEETLFENFATLGFEDKDLWKFGDDSENWQHNLARPLTYVGYDDIYINKKHYNFFMVAIRGSITGADWITDFTDGTRSFKSTAQNTKVGLVDAITKATNKTEEELKADNNIFFICGHSYGAATANRLSTMLGEYASDTNIFTYTFESPHTCWAGFEEPSSSVTPHNIINIKDIVPLLPWYPLATTYGEEHFFNSNLLSNSNFKEVCDGGNVELTPLCKLLGHHSLDLCLTALLQERKIEMPRAFYDNYAVLNMLDDRTTRLFLGVKCPVDVQVYCDGDLVCATQGIDYVNNDLSKASLISDGKTKYVVIDANGKYDIKFISTDDGTMEYLVGYYDYANKTTTIVKTFKDVKLEEGKEFRSEINPEEIDELKEAAAEKISLFVVDDDTDISEVNPDGTEVVIRPVVTSSVGNGGSIQPLGRKIFTKGSNQTYTITADTGYSIKDVVIDGESQGAISTYTFNNVTSNHTITATFIADTPTTYIEIENHAPWIWLGATETINFRFGGSRFDQITAMVYDESIAKIQDIGEWETVSTEEETNQIQHKKSSMNIRGISPGKTLAAVQLLDSSGNVLCRKTTDIMVANLELSDYYREIKVGENYDRLEASLNPSVGGVVNVTYESSNDTIATVDENGVIRALRPGLATIMVTSADGYAVKECDIVVYEEGGDEEYKNLTVPTANVRSGSIVEKNTEIILSCVDVGADIYYTMDGTMPTRKSILYTTPIKISEDMTIRAFAVKEGFKDSEDVMFTYTVRKDSGIDIDWGDILPEDRPLSGEIPDGIWVAGIREIPYTGKAVTQSFRIYDGSRRLKEKSDYTVSYKNNIKAYILEDKDHPSTEDKKKAPQVIIKTKGNYSGSRTVYFSITGRDIGDTTEFFVADVITQYNKKKNTPTPILTWNGKKLKSGKDFYVKEYEEEKGNPQVFVGKDNENTSYDLTLVGKGNYAGERKIRLTIFGTWVTKGTTGRPQVLLNQVKVSKIPDQPYMGAALTWNQLKQNIGGDLAFKVTYRNSILKENVDYEVADILRSDKIGTATVVLRGLNSVSDQSGYSFVGDREITFKIIGFDIKKAKISGLKKSYAYTGEEIRPDVGLEGVDAGNYTVEYQNNKTVGKATVVVKGINACTGTKKATFKITGYPMDGADIKVNGGTGEGLTAVYTKGGAEPDLEIRHGNRKLTEGKDYTLKYSNNKKIVDAFAERAPMVTIRGKGDFSGSRTLRYSITMADITQGVTMRANDVSENKKANKYQTKITLYDTDGKTLKAGTDYDQKNVKYYVMENNTERALTTQDRPLAGTVITVKVNGKGNYGTGEISGTYRILPPNRDISKAVFKIEKQPYTGRPITLTQQSQFMVDKKGNVQAYIKVGRQYTYLTLGKDFEVVENSYVKNVNKGRATVTLHGIGEYGGYKTVSFNIGTRSVSEWWKGLFR